MISSDMDIWPSSGQWQRVNTRICGELKRLFLFCWMWGLLLLKSCWDLKVISWSCWRLLCDTWKLCHYGGMHSGKTVTSGPWWKWCSLTQSLPSLDLPVRWLIKHSCLLPVVGVRYFGLAFLSLASEEFLIQSFTNIQLSYIESIDQGSIIEWNLATHSNCESL